MLRKEKRDVQATKIVGAKKGTTMREPGERWDGGYGGSEAGDTGRGGSPEELAYGAWVLFSRQWEPLTDR